MPNQRDPNKGHTSLTLPKDLLRALQAIAENEDRSRNKVIEILLTEQVASYHAKKDNLKPADPVAKELLRQQFGQSTQDKDQAAG